MADIEPYLTSIFSAAVCTAMVMYAFTRRRNGSRRIIFAVGAIVVVPVIVYVVISTQASTRGGANLSNWLIVGIPIWALLAVLTWVAGMGWFGFAKRVGDHPYCRKCGFDLFGKPADSTRCSECGADLEAKKSVVIGIRARRYWPLAASIFLIFLGLLIGGKMVYEWASNVEWIQYKPMWWLVSDLSGPNFPEAQREVNRRFQHDELSPRQIESLAKFGLTQPPGGRANWVAILSMQWMTTHDDLDETTARRLIQVAAPQGVLSIVPKIARGLPIPFRSYTISDYFNTDNFAGTVSQLHIQLSGVDLPLPSAQDDYNGRHVDPRALWSKIPDGPTHFAVQVDAVVHFRSHGKSLTEPITVKFSNPTIIASGAAADAPTTQPTGNDLASNWTATFGSPTGPNDDSNGLSIRSDHQVTRVVAHVILIDANGRQDIGIFDSSLWRSFYAGPGFRKPAADAHLELVPSPRETRNSWDQTPIVDRTIRVNDVRSEEK